MNNFNVDVMKGLAELSRIRDKNVNPSQSKQVPKIEPEKANSNVNKMDTNRVSVTKFTGACPACGADIVVENSIKTQS